jgi:RNA polymerase sigma factor (sigma-70 family)
MGHREDMMLDEDDLNGLYRYALALSHHRDDAYDLLQDCVEKYLKKLTTRGQSIDSPIAFIRTLIRNRYIDQYRHRQRWQSEPFDEDTAYDISATSLEQVCIDADSLRRIWRQLALQDRDILYHWAVLGYSTDEVSAILEIPRGTLLSRIHRLRKSIQADHSEYTTGEQTG